MFGNGANTEKKLFSLPGCLVYCTGNKAVVSQMCKAVILKLEKILDKVTRLKCLTPTRCFLSLGPVWSDPSPSFFSPGKSLESSAPHLAVLPVHF